MHNKFVRVYNYVSDNNVEMKAIYHSGDYSHCDERRVN